MATGTGSPSPTPGRQEKSGLPPPLKIPTEALGDTTRLGLGRLGGAGGVAGGAHLAHHPGPSRGRRPLGLGVERFLAARWHARLVCPDPVRLVPYGPTASRTRRHASAWPSLAGQLHCAPRATQCPRHAPPRMPPGRGAAVRRGAIRSKRPDTQLVAVACFVFPSVCDFNRVSL